MPDNKNEFTEKAEDFVEAADDVLENLVEAAEDAIERVRRAIPMLLRRGGHPLRRLHFLKELDERGLINDKDVGNRPLLEGSIG